MQSWTRNNSVATMCTCFQGTKLFVITILLFLLWIPHLDDTFYFCFKQFRGALHDYTQSSGKYNAQIFNTVYSCLF